MECPIVESRADTHALERSPSSSSCGENQPAPQRKPRRSQRRPPDFQGSSSSRQSLTPPKPAAKLTLTKLLSAGVVAGLAWLTAGKGMLAAWRPALESTFPLADDLQQRRSFCQHYLARQHEVHPFANSTAQALLPLQPAYQARHDQLEQRILAMGMPSYDYFTHGYQLLPNVLGIGSKLYTAIRMGQFVQQENLAGMAQLMWLQTVPYQLLEMTNQLQGIQRAIAGWKPTYAQSMRRLWQAVQKEDIGTICAMAPMEQQAIVGLYKALQQDGQALRTSGSQSLSEFGEPPGMAGKQPLEADRLYQRALQLRSLLLSIPQANHVLDVSHQQQGGNATIRAKIDTQLAGLISSYDPSLQHSLRDLVAQIRANVYVDTPQRAQAYFYGPPGVGKTYLVQELGKALDLPVVNIVLDPKSFRQQLLGHATGNVQSWLQSKLDVKAILGELASAIVDTGIVNPILFIDELNDIGGDEHRFVLRSLLKMLLDPQLTRLPMMAEQGVFVHFARATVILAGNEPILDKAIRSRLRQITFGPLPFATRQKVAQRTLVELAQNTAKLTDVHQQAIAAYCAQALPGILAVDSYYKLPGVRVLMQVIRQFHSYVQDAVLTNRLAALSQDEQQLLHGWYEQFGAIAPKAMPEEQILSAPASDLTSVG